jgi:hypothetical protein
VRPDPPLDRDSVVRMLAAFGDRAPAQVDDLIGSLELTWLITEVEQRYSVVVDLTEDDLDHVRTVADAVRILGGALEAADAAHPEGP